MRTYEGIKNVKSAFPGLDFASFGVFRGLIFRLLTCTNLHLLASSCTNLQLKFLRKSAIAL